jgi:hypothetical protein
MSYFIPIALATACLFVLISFWKLNSKFPGLKDSISSAQSFVAIVIVFVAVNWYFVERRNVPHANVDLSYSAVKIADDRIYIHMKASIENKSFFVIRPQKIVFRIYAIALSNDTLNKITVDSEDDFNQLLVGDASIYDGSEINFKGIREIGSAHAREIEPGETDNIFSDFIVDCKFKALKLSVSVNKQKNQDLFWKYRLPANIGKLCRGSIGEFQFYPQK